MQKVIENSKFHKISYVAKRDTFDFPVVYLIYDPKNNLLYIGHTNSLHSRMQEHMTGIGRGNLISKIKRRASLSEDIESYKIKYIKIEDYRTRCFSECVLLGIYQPPLNFTR